TGVDIEPAAAGATQFLLEGLDTLIVVGRGDRSLRTARAVGVVDLTGTGRVLAHGSLLQRRSDCARDDEEEIAATDLPHRADSSLTAYPACTRDCDASLTAMGPPP